MGQEIRYHSPWRRCGVRHELQREALRLGIKNPLQYSCLGNLMDREAWRATLPSGSVGKESACNSGSLSLIPGLRRYAGEGGLISLLPKGLSEVFSSTTIQKHQFFSTQSSLWSNSHIHTRLLENHCFDNTDLCRQSDVSAF